MHKMFFMRTDSRLARNGNALVRALLGGGSRVWGFPAKAAAAFATLVMLLGSGPASAVPIKYTMTWDNVSGTYGTTTFTGSKMVLEFTTDTTNVSPVSISYLVQFTNGAGITVSVDGTTLSKSALDNDSRNTREITVNENVAAGVRYTYFGQPDSGIHVALASIPFVATDYSGVVPPFDRTVQEMLTTFWAQDTAKSNVNYSLQWQGGNGNPPRPLYINGDALTVTTYPGVWMTGHWNSVLPPAPCPVTNNTDSGDGSLRAAVTNSLSTGCDITFDDAVKGQTITLLSTLPTIDKAIKITGPLGDSGKPAITIDGGQSVRLFDVVSGGTLTLESLVLQNGFADPGTLENGGAVRCVGGAVTVKTSTLQGNTANVGGAIYADGCAVEIRDSLLAANSGGAIYAQNGAAITVLNSTISGNLSESAAAIHGDNADQNGPVKKSSLVVVNSTITNNDGGEDAGGISGFGCTGTCIDDYGPGSVTLYNTVVAGNSSYFTDPGDPQECSIPGATLTKSNNFFGDDSCDGTASTGTLNLGLLADNGGPTDTHALGAESAAIDAGDDTVLATYSLTYDQRGSPNDRKGGGSQVDIGAYEIQPVNGACGGANGQILTSEPTGGLCASGTASSFTSDTTTYTWNCDGSYGGTTASCSATRLMVTASPTGGGSVSCTSPVIYNETTTCTVTANAGYVVTSVDGCGGTLNGSTYTTGAITGPCEITVTFSLAPTDMPTLSEWAQILTMLLLVVMAGWYLPRRSRP